jgi:excinuclease ABC subunit A
MSQNVIRVVGARQHNLKNITVEIPRDKLVVITGLIRFRKIIPGI